MKNNFSHTEEAAKAAVPSIEQDDLLITPYLSQEALPPIIRNMLPLASTPEEAVPAPQTSCQKDTLWALLPQEFSTEEGIKSGLKIGVVDRTVRRWFAEWINAGYLDRVSHGYYQKIA